MPCFAHDGYHELPPVARGTTVLLDGPAAGGLPAVAYIWAPSENRCDTHVTRAQPDITITHEGTLTSEIHGFIPTRFCRKTAAGARETLYTFPVSATDVNVVGPGVLDCGA